MTFKKINPKEKVFHYIEINSTTIAFYDSELDMPLAYGSKVIVSAIIKNLNPKIKINYYKIKNDSIDLTKMYNKK